MSFSTKQYEWSNTKINILGRTLVGVQGVSYKVTREKTPVYGRGNKPLAIQSGNKSFEGELMLLQSELELLRAAVKTINPLYDLTDISFDIVVSYERPTAAGFERVTDVVIGAEFTEYEKGMEQTDTQMEISLPFVALDLQEGI